VKVNEADSGGVVALLGILLLFAFLGVCATVSNVMRTPYEAHLNAHENCRVSAANNDFDPIALCGVLPAPPVERTP